MTGQFLAIAPEGRFDVESLELLTTDGDTILVRIVQHGQLTTIRVPLEQLQQHIAQLRSQPSATRTARAAVLFSPLPAAETPASAPPAADAVDDAAGSPPDAAAPRVTASGPGATDRPLPAPNVTGPEAAPSPSTAPRMGPARVTPLHTARTALERDLERSLARVQRSRDR